MFLSALIHLWFASGTSIDAPVPTAPQGTVILARIGLSVTPPAIPDPPQSEMAEKIKIAGKESPPRDGRSEDSPASAASSAGTVHASESAAPALPRTVDPVYYPARQLDVYPALLYPLRPEYPKQLSQRTVRAIVRVMVQIDETGKVNEVSTIEAEPAGYFERAVRKAFAEARFSPARKNGHAVKSRLLISVDFNPEDGSAR